MADLTDHAFLKENLFGKTSRNFREIFKKMILWNDRRWNEYDYLKENYFKTFGTLRYQDRKLSRAYSNDRILLAFIENGRMNVPSEKDLLEALKEVIDLKRIKGFYNVRNPRIVGIQFRDEEGKKIIEEKLTNVKDSNVISLEWISSSKNIELRVHWFPSEYCDAEIKDLLSQYVETLEFQKDEKEVATDTLFEESFLSVTATLKANIKSEDIPHLVILKGLEGLIVVRGRSPLCLRCEKMGHLAYECLAKFCTACRYFVNQDHMCESILYTGETYAQITASKVHKVKGTLNPDHLELARKSKPVEKLDLSLSKEKQTLNNVPYLVDKNNSVSSSSRSLQAKEKDKSGRWSDCGDSSSELHRGLASSDSKGSKPTDGIKKAKSLENFPNAMPPRAQRDLLKKVEKMDVNTLAVKRKRSVSKLDREDSNSDKEELTKRKLENSEHAQVASLDAHEAPQNAMVMPSVSTRNYYDVLGDMIEDIYNKHDEED